MPLPPPLPLPTRRATTRLAHAIAVAIAPGDLVVLDGTLGAGKTFLVRAMLRALGVPHEVAVPSPTFTLMNEYSTTIGARVPVLHADLYRLLEGEDAGSRVDDEIAGLGLRARRGDGWAVVVEWGGGHVSALGGEGVRIELRTEPARTAFVEPLGTRGEELARDVSARFASLSTAR